MPGLLNSTAIVAALCAAFAWATPANAEPITTLTLVVAGATILGTAAGVTSTFIDIFGDRADDDDFNDTPLYSTSAASPSLLVTATPFRFELFLQQANDVSSFEDDLAATLKGTSSGDFKGGTPPFWMFEFTAEADVSDDGVEFDIDGFVQHVIGPHDEPSKGQQEDTKGSPLDFNLSYFRSFDEDQKLDTLTPKELESRIHPGNTGHFDTLETAELKVRCCSTTGFNHLDFYSLRLIAQHPREVPLPPTLLLFISGLGLFVMTQGALRLLGRQKAQRQYASDEGRL